MGRPPKALMIAITSHFKKDQQLSNPLQASPLDGSLAPFSTWSDVGGEFPKLFWDRDEHEIEGLKWEISGNHQWKNFPKAHNMVFIGSYWIYPKLWFSGPPPAG